MNPMMVSVALVLLATISMVSSACDMLKEFKPDYDKISSWAEDKCKTSSTLQQSDLDKAKACYESSIKPLLTSEAGQKVATLVETKVFGNDCVTNVCTDKTCQDSIKKSAMKDVGMKNGMALKKEIEADCPKYKTVFETFNSCIQS